MAEGSTNTLSSSLRSHDFYFLCWSFYFLAWLSYEDCPRNDNTLLSLEYSSMLWPSSNKVQKYAAASSIGINCSIQRWLVIHSVGGCFLFHFMSLWFIWKDLNKEDARCKRRHEMKGKIWCFEQEIPNGCKSQWQKTVPAFKRTEWHWW